MSYEDGYPTGEYSSLDSLTLEEAWSRLSLFHTVDVLERRYGSLHTADLDESKAREIASHLIQAREYFSSAAGAGALIRPLLLYYSVLAFAVDAG